MPKCKSPILELKFYGTGYETILNEAVFASVMYNPKMNAIIYSQLAVAMVERMHITLSSNIEEEKSGHSTFMSFKVKHLRQ